MKVMEVGWYPAGQSKPSCVLPSSNIAWQNSVELQQGLFWEQTRNYFLKIDLFR